jgi:hypothetical protein
MLEEIERAKRSRRAEIVPYGAYELKTVRIPVERPGWRGGDRGRES